MNLGVILPMFSGSAERVLGFSRDAERLGYDGVFAFDHFFPPEAPADRPSLEAFVTLAAVAGSTTSVRVGTLVTRAQLRPAGLLAKMTANIDHLSGGRMILGIGTGDPIDEPEHRAFGFPTLSKKERRAHLAETVPALKALFRGEAWPGGHHVPPIRGPLLPPVTSPGGPPIWIGGQADPVVRLAATIADGWNGWGMTLEVFEGKSRLLREEADRAGRTVESTWAGLALVAESDSELRSLITSRREKGLPVDGVWTGTVPAFRDFLRGLGDRGCAWVVIVPSGPSDRLELIGREVLPHVRSG